MTEVYHDRLLTERELIFTLMFQDLKCYSADNAIFVPKFSARIVYQIIQRIKVTFTIIGSCYDRHLLYKLSIQNTKSHTVYKQYTFQNETCLFV